MTTQRKVLHCAEWLPRFEGGLEMEMLDYAGQSQPDTSRGHVAATERNRRE